VWLSFSAATSFPCALFISKSSSSFDCITSSCSFISFSAGKEAAAEAAASNEAAALEAEVKVKGPTVAACKLKGIGES